MLDSSIMFDPAVLADVCQSFGVARLRAFGSALRDDFDPSRSDLDLLVDFDAEASASLFTLIGLEEKLTALFGRKVDLMTPGSLSKYFRDEVLALAEPLYVAP